jgi:nucleotide-binding universal stress UspA family protein
LILTLPEDTMFRRILVPIDGSDAGRQGLIEALRLAPSWGATLRLLHVTCTSPFSLETADAADLAGHRRSLRERAEHVLGDASALARKAGLAVETAVREPARGALASAIVDDACSSDCDLVVMGTHGRSGLARAAAGCNAEDVVRKSVVPVLVVRHRPKTRRRRTATETSTAVKARSDAVSTSA